MTNDLISRQRAINAIVEQSVCTIEEVYDICNGNFFENNGWLGGLKAAIDAVKEVPSTEPQIIYCKDCKLFRLSDNGKFGICKKHKGILNPTDFCSFAERRTE